MVAEQASRVSLLVAMLAVPLGAQASPSLPSTISAFRSSST
jgi:hypothetical protein